MTDKSRKPFSRSTTWALLLIFFLPLLIAAALYMTRGQWDLGTKQKGELLIPPLTFQELGIKNETKEWRLLVVAPDCINAACELLLAKVESIHEATGKDFNRVRSLLLTKTPQVDKKLLENFNYVNWQLLPANSPIKDGLFIADPNGFIILYYPSDGDALNTLEDLRHLLRNSQIG